MSSIYEIHDYAEEDSFIANNNKAVIFFGSSGCGHCRSVAPLYSELVNKYPDVAFAHVEVGPIKVKGLEGVPTFVSYRNQMEHDIIIGERKNALTAMVASL